MMAVRIGRSISFAIIALVLPLVQAQPTWLSFRQLQPGEVTARLQTDAAHPPDASAVSLEIDGTRIAAASLMPVAKLAPSTAMLICLDRSGSMSGAGIAAVRDALREALTPGVGESRLPILVAITAFGSQIEQLSPFTDDPAVLTQAIARYANRPSGDSNTRLHDAVIAGLAQLRAKDFPVRRLMVITDGKDEGSGVRRIEDVLQAVANERARITVDGIGFGPIAAKETGSIATIVGRSDGRFAFAYEASALRHALRDMVRETVQASPYDAVFHYVPVAGGHQAGSARLVYQPAGGKAVAYSPVEVPAAMAGGNAGSTVKVPDKPAEYWWERVLGKIKIDLGGLHLGLKLVLSGIPVALLGWLGWRHHRRRVEYRWRHELSIKQVSAIQPPASPTAVPERPAEPSAPAAVNASRRDTVVGHQWPAPSEGRVVAVLHGRSEDGAGQHFKVMRSDTRVGAAHDNDLVLDNDDEVSARHAQIKAENHGLYVNDLRSTNGTRLNDRWLRGGSAPLVPGDRLRFGRSEFEVLTADAVRR